MDVSIRVNGSDLYNVTFGDGYIQADMPSTLYLRPVDMAGIDVGNTDCCRQGYISVRLADGLYLRLMYPLPPTQQCACCKTKQYSDTLEYVSEALVEQYPSLREYRWSYVCKSCIGLHIDEQESVLPVA